MVEEIPKNIILKTQYSLYKQIRPHYISEISTNLLNFISVANQKIKEADEIEIEIKIGKFVFEGNYSLFNDIKDIIIIPSYANKGGDRLYFKSDVKNYFDTIWFYINNEAKFDKEVTLIDPILSKEFIFPSGARLSYAYDFKNELKKKEMIVKSNKNHINLKYNENLDLRVTACVEEKVNIRDVERPKDYREKLRISYLFNFFRIDFTIVKSVYNAELLSGTKPFDVDYVKNFFAEGLKYEMSHEIELEFVGLKHFLNNFRDEKMFENLINRFVENAFMMIKSAVSKEFYFNMPNRIAVIEKYIYSSRGESKISEGNNNNKNEINNNNNVGNLSNEVKVKESVTGMESLKYKSIYGNYFEYNN
jgi:hypothetical protein